MYRSNYTSIKFSINTLTIFILIKLIRRIHWCSNWFIILYPNFFGHFFGVLDLIDEDLFFSLFDLESEKEI